MMSTPSKQNYQSGVSKLFAPRPAKRILMKGASYYSFSILGSYTTESLSNSWRQSQYHGQGGKRCCIHHLFMKLLLSHFDPHFQTILRWWQAATPAIVVGTVWIVRFGTENAFCHSLYRIALKVSCLESTDREV